MQSQTTKIGPASATAFVIANMIGTGVFTSLGFQLLGTSDLFSVIMLWVIGGIVALCGALCYGELGAAMPRSGGEYHYLARIYHPALGFASGFVSMTIGFAAPVALACMAFGTYASRVVPGVPAVALAIGALATITFIHGVGVSIGVKFQNIATLLKVALILVFILCGILIAKTPFELSFLPTSDSWSQITAPAFAISLIYVSYAYSGWNAAAYIAGEMDNPQKTLPLVLTAGTLVVSVLYVLLNYTFLATSPAAELKGQIDVGYVSAQHLFGGIGGTIIGALISLLLVSSISSMVFVGPRVTQVIGEDLRMFSFFSKRSRDGSPLAAILFQAGISFLFILTGSFEKVLTYIGFTLNLFTFLAVAGVFVHRARFPSSLRPYKTWGYPVVPLLFLALCGWTLVYLLIDKPTQSLSGLATAAAGVLVFFINKTVVEKRRQEN